MHLKTREVSLKNFDENCVDGVSGCARIGIIWFSFKIGKKGFGFGNEGSD